MTVHRLDAVRALAATYVVIGHALPGTVIHDTGVDAVIVFFLLSDFVIQANEGQRARLGPLAFLGRRARRLLPVLAVALALTLGTAAVTGTLQAALHLTFLGDTPLWSLGYEVVYYGVYPLLLLIPARSRLPFVLAVSGLSVLAWGMFPSYLFSMGAVLAVWWAGAEVARNHGYPTWRLWPVMLGLLVLALLGWAGGSHTGLSIDVAGPVLTRAFVVAAALILLTASPSRAKVAFDRWLGRAAFVAPFSYGLYVVHYPIIAASNSMPIRLLVSVPLAFLLAWVAESALRKGGWVSHVVQPARVGGAGVLVIGAAPLPAAGALGRANSPLI